MRFGEIRPQIGITDTWELVEETTVTGSAITTFTFSNLTGDTDEVYRMVVFGVNGYSGTAWIAIRPNNDSGSNYGDQYLRGAGASITSARATSETRFVMANSSATALGNIINAEMILYAKSGYVRTAIISGLGNTTGTTVSDVSPRGQSWNNTGDEITSLVVTSNQTGGIGVGSYLALYRKVV